MLRAISVIFLLVAVISWYSIICDAYGFVNFTDKFLNLIAFFGSGIWLVAFIATFLAAIFWWVGSDRY